MTKRVLSIVLVIVVVILAVILCSGSVYAWPQIRSSLVVVGPAGPAGPQGPAGPAGQNSGSADLLQNPEPASPAPVTPLVATCILDSFPEEARFGVQLEVNKLTNADWEFNPQTAKRVSGDSTHPELKADADLSGCPVLVEGRKVLNEEHHIWILMFGDKQYLDADGIFYAKEFSAWAYPSNWNMEDFSTAKAPIAGEFVDAKVNNMKANGYSWPIFVHKSDGTTFQFKAGDKVGAILPNNCNFAAPSHLNVTGVYNMSNKTFDASIGGEGCWVAAEVDGKWQYWQGAKDNIVFTTIDAWLMPSTFTEQNVIDWIAKQ